MILLLCAPFAVTAQIRYSDPANRNEAKRIGEKVEETVKVKEPKWKLKLLLEAEFGQQHYFKSGKKELDIAIFVYDSVEEASKQLVFYSNSSSLTASLELKDVGDEAFYISHRYFSWIGVRKGRKLVLVHGPGPNLTVTMRFVGYGLAEMEK
jgi:hypothetical protein